MKKIAMTSMLILGLSWPVFAATSTDINNQKNQIQQKYDNEKNSENQSYNTKVSEAKQNYQNDPTKLNNVLKELEIKHTKKMDDLNNNENLALQKASE